MNQLLKQVTVFLLLYVCATTASAQDSRTTSSSSLLYQSVNKPAVIAEDHETLEKTIPSATIRRTKPTRVGAARKIKPYQRQIIIHPLRQIIAPLHLY